MTAGRTRRGDVIAARLPDAPTLVSPWTADATVLAEAAHDGRYGDPVWRFGSKRPTTTPDSATCPGRSARTRPGRPAGGRESAVISGWPCWAAGPGGRTRPRRA